MATAIKLNQKRSIALVYGMPGVTYQQDDQLFDGEGTHVGPLYPPTKKGKAAPVVHEVAEEPEEVEAAPEVQDNEYYTTFLRQVLEGGPMLKSEVFKLVEDRKLEWDRMRTLAAEINIHRFNRKSQEYWELGKE